MKESKIQNDIRIACNTGSTRAWRNNIAKLQVKGQWVNFGIPSKGGSDLIGLHTMEIQPKHIGKSVAVFVAIEVKTPTGKPSPEQIRFIEFAKKSGAIAGIARSPEEATNLITQYEPI
jgi:hypothetical protein